MRSPRKPASPCRYFNFSPEVIGLLVMYVRFPLSRPNVQNMLFERGIDICLHVRRSRNAALRSGAQVEVEQC